MLVRFGMHYFVLFAVIAGLNAYLPLILRARRFDNAQVGILMGIVNLAGVAGPLAAGYLSDLLGRRRGLLIGCLVAFALLLLPLSGVVGLAAAAMLAVGIGLVGRTPIPLTDTLATAHLPDAASQYGRVRVWGSLGYVLTLLGIRAFGLVNEQSATAMTVAMAVPTLLAILTALPLPDRHHAAAGRAGLEGPSTAFGGVFWVFLLAAAMHQFGMTAHYTFFSLYLHDELGMERAGWVWALGSIAELPVIFFGGRALRATGLAAAMIAASAAVALRLAVYALAPSLPAVLAAQGLHALTFGLFHIASIDFVRRKAPAARRGLAMALYMALAIGLPSWIGSTAGGMIVKQFGYRALYLSYALTPLIGILCIAAIGRKMPTTIAAATAT